MIITSQGFGHFTHGLNNQDFGIETERMVLILDGCSGAKFSEIGTRLFAQLYSRKEESDSVEKFEDNVRSVFDDISKMMEKYYPTIDDLRQNFIMDNLLFTIIACFETENEYIVKIFGDGYIITQNTSGCISYMRFNYGKCPPYFAYKYCELEDYKNYDFKTFKFSKTAFKKVAIATDGVLPIAKGEVKGLDNYIMQGNDNLIAVGINSQRQCFVDDVTIGALGGKDNGNF